MEWNFSGLRGNGVETTDTIMQSIDNHLSKSLNFKPNEKKEKVNAFQLFIFEFDLY
jgi:hypothetical protein